MSKMFGWTVLEYPGPAGICYIFQSEGNEVTAMFFSLVHLTALRQSA